MLSQPDSALSDSAHAGQMLELMYKLMEYRSDEVRHRLEKVGRAASMLHMDVLLLIYHFAGFGAGIFSRLAPILVAQQSPPHLVRASPVHEKKDR